MTVALQFTNAPAATGRMPSLSRRRCARGLPVLCQSSYSRSRSRGEFFAAPSPISLSASTSGWNLSCSSANTQASTRCGAVAGCLRERAVGAAAHRDVVVDVHRPAGEAAGQEAGDEQRDVAEPLQRAEALAVIRRAGGVGEQQRERLQLRAAVVRLEEGVRVREHRQQVDDVVLGVVLDVQVLAIERGLERIAEELAHVADGLELHGAS